VPGCPEELTRWRIPTSVLSIFAAYFIPDESVYTLRRTFRTDSSHTAATGIVLGFSAKPFPYTHTTIPASGAACAFASFFIWAYTIAAHLEHYSYVGSQIINMK
jgi:hypothetical protein